MRKVKYFYHHARIINDINNLQNYIFVLITKVKNENIKINISDTIYNLNLSANLAYESKDKLDHLIKLKSNITTLSMIMRSLVKNKEITIKNYSVYSKYIHSINVQLGHWISYHQGQ